MSTTLAVIYAPGATSPDYRRRRGSAARRHRARMAARRAQERRWAAAWIEHMAAVGTPASQYPGRTLAELRDAFPAAPTVMMR